MRFLLKGIVMVVDVLTDSFIDNIKILPFLFLTFLLMEYIEDRMNDRLGNVLKNAGKCGPVWGSLIGVVPQCGFSAAGSNLYAGRVISVGTLIAIFLSNSDEMLPIMISEAASPALIVKILLCKVVIGIFAGFMIDYIYKCVLKKKVKEVDIHHFCEHEHCECGKGIIRPALKHTVKIFLFLFIISFVLGIVIEAVGLETISVSFINSKILGPLVAGLIGLIPNCAASVLITALFLENAISFGTMMSGLLVGAGVGILVLARVNEDKKENLIIISLLFFIGVLTGILFNLFM